MSYTILKEDNGKPIFCTCAKAKGTRTFAILEFAGKCEDCWIKLKPEERKILTESMMGTNEPARVWHSDYPNGPSIGLLTATDNEPPVVTETRYTLPAAQSVWDRIILGTWRISITLAVFLEWYSRKHGR